MVDGVENTWDRINSNDTPCEICRLIIVMLVKYKAYRAYRAYRAYMSEKKNKISRFLIEKSCRYRSFGRPRR